MTRPIRRATRWLGILLFAARPAAAQFTLPLDSALAHWGRTHAIPTPDVDRPYADADYAWLGPLVGPARMIAVGENIHGAHEPLAFRNQVIRYAVRKLGVTAIGFESGFSEAVTIDRFIQGGPGAVDSVLKAGLSYGFGRLPENREIVLWLREHNATAAVPVHFYGLDQSGVDGEYEGRVAVDAALAALESADPAGAAALRTRLTPLLARFAVPRFGALSPAERASLDRALAALDAAAARASWSDARARALGTRHAWAARRLFDAGRVSGAAGSRAPATIRLRDSVMAENARWLLAGVRPGERVLIFAHNGHVMDVPMAFPAMGIPTVMTGQRLRAALGPRLVVIGTAATVFDSLGAVPADPSTFEAALVRLATPGFALDLRTSDRDPRVRALLALPWLTRIHAWLQTTIPRRAADVMVVFPRVAATRMLP